MGGLKMLWSLGVVKIFIVRKHRFIVIKMTAQIKLSQKKIKLKNVQGGRENMSKIIEYG